MNVIETIKSLFSRKKWTYLGTVDVETHAIFNTLFGGKEGTYGLAFNLYQADDGSRKFTSAEEVKHHFMGQDAKRTFAQLVAWKQGADPQPEWKLINARAKP